MAGQIKRRWWLIIIAVMLLQAGWCADAPPPAMPLVARHVVCDNQGVRYQAAREFDTDGAMLCIESLHTPPGNRRLSLIGWDAQPRWQIEVPSSTLNMGQMCFSPDGRRLVIITRESPTRMRVRHWRDGRKLPDQMATLPWRWEVNDPTLVTDDGHVWLIGVEIEKHPDQAALISLDGTQMAMSLFPLADTGAQLVDGTPLCSSFSLSPDGTALLSYFFGTVAYAMVSVHGTQVKLDWRYRCSYPERVIQRFGVLPEIRGMEAPPFWWRGKLAMDNYGTICSPRGMKPGPDPADYDPVASPEGQRVNILGFLGDVHNGRYWGTQTTDGFLEQPLLYRDAHKRMHVNVPPAPSWELPEVSAGTGCCSEDGSTVLLTQPGPWLFGVYTAPGRLRSVMPFSSIDAGDHIVCIDISHDGRHALFQSGPPGKEEWSIYQCW